MKNNAFTLIEAIVTLVVLGFIAMLTVPSMVSGSAEKNYLAGYNKAFDDLSLIVDLNPIIPVFNSEKQNIKLNSEDAASFAINIIRNMKVKELYAEANPNNKSRTYATLKFSNNELAIKGEDDCNSQPIKITSEPSFWFVTENNLAYSVILPVDGQCKSVTSINSKTNLNDALKASCYAVIVDTNGLFNKPNQIEQMQDISAEKYMPNLTNDRYYMFVGNNGLAAGGANNLITGKMRTSKRNK